MCFYLKNFKTENSKYCFKFCKANFLLQKFLAQIVYVVRFIKRKINFLSTYQFFCVMFCGGKQGHQYEGLEFVMYGICPSEQTKYECLTTEQSKTSIKRNTPHLQSAEFTKRVYYFLYYYKV